jgi:hypothetical protein
VSGAETPRTLDQAEEAIAAARARLSADVSTLHGQASLLMDPERPVLAARSSERSTDAVDMAAVALRAFGKLQRFLRDALRRPGPVVAAASVTFALLQRRRNRRRRRLAQRS